MFFYRNIYDGINFLQRGEKCDIIRDVKVLFCDVIAIVMLFHIHLVRVFSCLLGIKFTYMVVVHCISILILCNFINQRRQMFSHKFSTMVTTLLNGMGITREVLANESERKVVKGYKYQLDNIFQAAFSTKYVIKGSEYNSVLFEEDNTSSLMKALAEVKDVSKVRLVTTLKKAQKITLMVGQSQTIVSQDEFLNIPIGDVLTIGRGDCDIQEARFENAKEMIRFGFNLSVSRMHCIVYREKSSLWRVLDTSSFGTSLILG